VARKLLQSVCRVANLKARLPALLQETDHQRSRPHLHRRSPLAHVGVADNYVQASETAWRRVRFVPGVDNWTVVQRIYARLDVEEICPLGELKQRLRSVGFHA